MKSILRLALLGSLAGTVLCGTIPTSNAQDVTRLPTGPTASIVPAVTVPAGHTLYFFSGSVATVKTPAANGKPPDRGDISEQTASALDNMQKRFDTLGLTFGNVVAAHVFFTPPSWATGDPAKGADADFAAMNKVWRTKFGTPTQPNRPARTVMTVDELADPGALLEIEFIAVK